MITANEKPDHCSINRFRALHAAAMKKLFIEILRLCAEAGLLKVGKVNLDGTKMKANASLAAKGNLTSVSAAAISCQLHALVMRLLFPACFVLEL